MKCLYEIVYERVFAIILNIERVRRLAHSVLDIGEMCRSHLESKSFRAKIHLSFFLNNQTIYTMTRA